MCPEALTVIPGGKADEAEYGSQLWANRMRRESRELARAIDVNYLRLGKNLWVLFDTPINGDAKNNPWWVKWGYGHITDFEEKELGMNPKVAERLRRMWKVLGVDLKDAMNDALMERIIALGRSRVRELTRDGVLTKDNILTWIEKAEKLNYTALLEEVSVYLSGRTGVMKGTLGKVEPTDPDGDILEDDTSSTPTNQPVLFDKSKSQQIKEGVESAVGDTTNVPEEKLGYKHFALFPSQMDTVTAALERAQEMSGSKKDGQNLSLIALDFLATNDFKKSDMEQVQRWLIRAEKALGVKLVALDSKTHEILYGYKLLDKLVKGE